MGFESTPVKIEKTCPSCQGDKVDSKDNKCRTCNGKGTVNKS